LSITGWCWVNINILDVKTGAHYRTLKYKTAISSKTTGIIYQ
jgi:hypothetical protein